MMGLMQIQANEPGDADWGVSLDDVRGQAEAREDVRRVSSWQSARRSKPPVENASGLLMLSAPGTPGRRCCPKPSRDRLQRAVRDDPGSRFAQTFIGLDAVIVRWLAWKAKRLARKWGGQCIVFIDEIDAVWNAPTLARHPAAARVPSPSFEELSFYGPSAR